MLQAVLHREAPHEHAPLSFQTSAIGWSEQSLINRVQSSWEKGKALTELRSQGLWQLALWAGPGFRFGPYRPWTLPAPPSSYLFLNLGPQGYWLARKSAANQVLWAVSHGLENMPTLLESAPVPGHTREVTWEHITSSSYLSTQWDDDQLGALTALWAGGLRCLLPSQTSPLGKPPATQSTQGPPSPPKATPGPKSATPQWQPTCVEPISHVAAHRPQAVHQEFVAWFGPSSRCTPVGSRSYRGVEHFFGKGTSRCLYSFSPLDPRLPEAPTTTKIFCFDSATGAFVVTDTERALGIYPKTTSGEFLVYEGAYRPPRLSHLHTSPPRQTVADQTLGAWGRGPRGALWERPVGVYACKGHHRPLDPALDALPDTEPRTWLMVPRNLYRGQEALDEALHQVVAVTRSPFHAEHLSWAQAAKWYPALNDFPPMACVFLPHMDVKCGLRVVQHTGQLAVENLLGLHSPDLVNPALQEALYIMSYELLVYTNKHLKGWQLENHAVRLANHFLAQLKRLQGTKYGALTAQARGPLPAQPPTLMRYLNLPWGMWSKL